MLYPDFEPRTLASGKVRAADLELSSDKNWVKAGGGTWLFDRPSVFKSRGWVAFQIPAGTVVPQSLIVRRTGYNKTFQADPYQIECTAERMRLDAFKGALDNLARNAVVRSIELAKSPGQGQHHG